MFQEFLKQIQLPLCTTATKRRMKIDGPAGIPVQGSLKVCIKSYRRLKRVGGPRRTSPWVYPCFFVQASAYMWFSATLQGFSVPALASQGKI